MKKANKKRGLILIASVLTILSVVGLLTAAAPQGQYTYKAVIAFSLYENTDTSGSVLAVVPQNAVVTPVGEAITVDGQSWQKVTYLELQGYTLSSNVFLSNKNDSFHFTVAKAKSSAMGKTIALYAVHSETAEPVKQINDGEKLRIVDDGISYGKFLRVEYDGGYYFAYEENVTTGLSMNQTLALIITGSVLGGVIVIVVIVLAIRRRKKRI